MKLLREPLVHFLMLGAVVFLLVGVRGAESGGKSGEIVVTRAQIETLTAGFTRLHRRPPSPGEMDGLIEDYLREEVSYREAVALGLDRDDAVIRQRLRQKMEFVSDDVAAMATPTDAQLSAFLKEHPDAFRVEPRVTFAHVYLDPARRRDGLARDTAQLLAQLTQAGVTADVSALGDPFLLEQRFEAAAASEVASLFGERFAADVLGLALGQWRGPIESGYGTHLVLVSERKEGRVPPLENVRDAVRREWATTERQRAKAQLFAGLLNRYSVTIEQPEPNR